MPTLTINNIPVEVPEGTTILQAARQAGIHIPTLCYLEDLQAIGACRVCVVEVEGARNLVASCSMPVDRGHEGRQTNTAGSARRRRTVVELLLSEHNGDCQTCDRSEDCELQALAAELGIREVALRRREDPQADRRLDAGPGARQRQVHQVPPLRDASAPRSQDVGALFPQNRGFETVIGPAFNRDLSDVACVQCGQCAAVCPVGAITEKDQIDEVWKALDDPTKHVVVQTAPAIRAALGECFGYPPGTLVTGKMVAALRRLGFDAVFDTNFAADLTIIEEGTELLDAAQEGAGRRRAGRPAACSPAARRAGSSSWSTSTPTCCRTSRTCKSPQQMFGARGQDLLRREAGQAARGHLRRLDHALHGQEVRVPAARDERQRRARRGRRADHARAGQDDPRGRHRLPPACPTRRWTPRWASPPAPPTSSPTPAA